MFRNDQLICRERGIACMKMRMKVLVAGRNAAELKMLEDALGGQTSIDLSTRLITNGHSDPLYNMPELPDALIFCTTVAWRDELESLEERPLSMRPPTVVIGAGDTDSMRLAMRVGARDYFSFPLPPQELIESLKRIELELYSSAADDEAAAPFVVVINAKGGGGASTVAATLAHGLANRIGQRTVLVDMDLQFGNLSSLFDLPPGGGLIEAALRVDSIDAMALDGHMLKHKSGLHILGNAPEQLIVPGEVEEGRLRKLVDILRSNYDHVVVDLPRQIDSITGMMLEYADRILMVVQQSVPHVQDAKQLLRYLTQYLGVSEQRITVIINRWDKRADLTPVDIEKATGLKDLLCIPNDFARVAESANLGIPLLEAAPGAPVGRAMVQLAEVLSGKRAVRDESGIGRVLRKLTRA